MAQLSAVQSLRSEPDTWVTSEQIRQYVQDGYLVVPGLIGSQELELLKNDLVDMARGKYPCPSLTPLPAELNDRQVLERILCIHQPHRFSPVIRSFIAHPGIAAVLSEVTAAHLAPGWWDGGVKCMQSMLFVKPPKLPGQAWHQDEHYIPTRDRSLIGAWIAMDDATVENGCLFVLPGSHRRGYLYPVQAHNQPTEFDTGTEAYGFDDSQELAVEVDAGSVVFFNGYLLHRSRCNRTQGYRRALVNHYMSMNSLLPWGVENEVREGRIHIARADCRAVIPVCGTDPDADKGYLEPVDDVYLRPYAIEAIEG
jgi:phytanoyl-CoA hydroxylase